MNLLPPWSLPLIVIALLVPPIAGLLLLGPQGMMLAAVIVGVAVTIIVARRRPGSPIEVAASGDDRPRVLIAAIEAIDSPRLAEHIARHVKLMRASGEDLDPEVLVLSPALSPLLDRWAVDVAEARAGAKARLEASLDRLSRAGVDARGAIGDSNPMLAIEDALREFPAGGVIVVGGEEAGSDLAGELRERLDRPVEVLSPAAG